MTHKSHQTSLQTYSIDIHLWLLAYTIDFWISLKYFKLRVKDVSNFTVDGILLLQNNFKWTFCLLIVDNGNLTKEETHP